MPLEKDTENKSNNQKNQNNSKDVVSENKNAVNNHPVKQDIFDKIMLLPGLRIFNKFYRKHKSLLLYIFFGGLTTLVSLGTFALFNYAFNINILISNILSWVCAVTFAYVTNRSMVFHSKAKGWKILLEAFGFYAGRLFSLGVEELILWIFVTYLNLNEMIIKIIAQIIVLILNYALSKILFFCKKR